MTPRLAIVAVDNEAVATSPLQKNKHYQPIAYRLNDVYDTETT